MKHEVVNCKSWIRHGSTLKWLDNLLVLIQFTWEMLLQYVDVANWFFLVYVGTISFNLLPTTLRSKNNGVAFLFHCLQVPTAMQKKYLQHWNWNHLLTPNTYFLKVLLHFQIPWQVDSSSGLAQNMKSITEQNCQFSKMPSCSISSAVRLREGYIIDLPSEMDGLVVFSIPLITLFTCRDKYPIKNNARIFKSSWILAVLKFS